MGNELSLDAFLAAPVEQIRHYAPETVFFAAGGTRREAVLGGVDIRDPRAYAEFGRKRFLDTAARMFALGVKHLFALTIHSKQLLESGYYRQMIVDMTIEGLGEPAIPGYTELGCKVRFHGQEDVPELQPLADALAPLADVPSEHTIWWLTTLSNEAVWARTFDAIRKSSNLEEATRAYFGVDVPPAGIFLSFGKPFVSPEILPPLLLQGETHCYWYQRPGYYLSDEELRRIIYDYAIARHTWLEDKSDRYDTVLRDADQWQQNPILGLGHRQAGFWHPSVGQE